MLLVYIAEPRYGNRYRKGRTKEWGRRIETIETRSDVHKYISLVRAP